MYDTDKDIGQEIEDGSYFQAARNWYSVIYHTPIAERSYYIVVILLAFINGYFAFLSFTGIFPISPRIPFYVYSDDVWEEIPHINRLTLDKNEDKNVAVMKFLIQTYVVNRESYDLKLFELRYRNVWSQSTPDVFDKYKALMDPANPYGPYRLYANKDKRNVTVDAIDYSRGAKTSWAHIIFHADVVDLTTDQIVGRSRWQANIIYTYTDFSVDQSLDASQSVARFFGLAGNSTQSSRDKRKVVPMTFTVSDYQVKELVE